MSQVVVTEALRNALLNFSQPLEICDDRGQVLARVLPVFDPSQYERWEPVWDEDDLHRQEQANEKRYSTAELLNRLEQL